MLTASKILEEIKNGNIVIEPFNIKQLNPNSYNCRLGTTLKVYDVPKSMIINPKKLHMYPTKTIEIGEEGLAIFPGELYITNVEEKVSTDKYISAIDGRSSIGRLGIQIHSTAGFGDIGFSGNYTLEISCIKPVMLFPHMEIAQLYFSEPYGDIDFLYHGRYQNQTEPTISRLNIDENNISGYHYKEDNDVK